MLGEPATLAWHTSLLNKLLYEHKLKLLDWSLPWGLEASAGEEEQPAEAWPG